MDLQTLEERTPPGFFAAANPLATAIGLNAVGLFSTDTPARSASEGEFSWHSPTSESTVFVGRISNPSHDIAAATTPARSASEGTISATTQGAGRTSAPRSGDGENWAAFSSSDLIPDPFALDPAFSLLSNTGGSLSGGGFDDANLHSPPADGGTSSGAGGINSLSADNTGVGGPSSPTDGNGLGGLVGNGPASGGGNSPSSASGASNGPGTSGIANQNTPLANTAGLPTNVLLPPVANASGHGPLLDTGQVNDDVPDLNPGCG